MNFEVKPLRRTKAHRPQQSPSLSPQVDAPSPAVPSVLFRPLSLQRRVVQPVLAASALLQADTQARALQRQRLVAQAQEAAQPAPPAPSSVPAAPRSPADWVTVMRHQAQQTEGKALSAREWTGWTALQRQVATQLSQGYRREPGPTPVRQERLAAHLAYLQGHPLSAPVAGATLALVPPGERPALQRALDAALAREHTERAQLAQQTLQRQLAELDAQEAQPALERIQARRGAGNPLPEAVQRHLEQGLNHDLSRVRIHADAEAHTLAKGVNATAFTSGTDIYFQAGRYDPNTQTGLELLAHEATHAVQQMQGQVGPGIDPDAGLETQAQNMGRQVAAMPRQAVRRLGAVRASGPGMSGPALQRKTAAPKAQPQMPWPQFMALFKVEALQRLQLNAQQLQKEIKKYEDTSGNAQWDRLFKLIEQDRRVRQGQRTLLARFAQQYPQGVGGLPLPRAAHGQITAPSPEHWLTYLEAAKKQLRSPAVAAPLVGALQQLAISENMRASAHREVPALSALADITGPLNDKTDKKKLLGTLKQRFARTAQAIQALQGEIKGGNIPWKYADALVNTLFTQHGVQTTAPAYQTYVAEKRKEVHSQAALLLLSVGVGVAAAFFTGGLSLALAGTAVALGGYQSVKNVGPLLQQAKVAEASRYGQNLTSQKADQARFNVALGFMDVALGAVNVAAFGKAGLAVASLGKINKLAKAEGLAIDAASDARLAAYAREEVPEHLDFYRLLRNRQDDVAAIAKVMPQFSEADIRFIKMHLMVRYQLVPNDQGVLAVKRFDPNPDDALAWHRAASGQPLSAQEKNFLNTWFGHELAEAKALRDYPELMTIFLEKGDLRQEILQNTNKFPPYIEGGKTKTIQQALLGDKDVITPYRYAHYLAQFNGHRQPKEGLYDLYVSKGLVDIGYELTKSGQKELGLK